MKKEKRDEDQKQPQSRRGPFNRPQWMTAFRYANLKQFYRESKEKRMKVKTTVKAGYTGCVDPNG
jgi:hypothetical protein